MFARNDSGLYTVLREIKLIMQVHLASKRYETKTQV